jgi:sporulation related protein
MVNDPVCEVMISAKEAAASQALGGTTLYEVQVGAFLERAQAAEVLEQLWERYPTAYITTREGPVGRYYRVRVGPFETQAQAQQLARILRQEGYAVFVDAPTAPSLPGSPLRLAGERRLRAPERVGGGTANTAAQPLLPVGRTHISMLALMVLAVASSLLIWTRQWLFSAQQRNPVFANARPLPRPPPQGLHASEGRSP